MSCLDLVKLVKAYTHGEIPLEVYREKRRQIVDAFTEVQPPRAPTKKADELDSFLASAPEKPPARHSHLFLAVAVTTAVVLAIGIGVMVFTSDESQDAIQQTANQNPQVTARSKAQKLIDDFVLANRWDEESINQFILDWQILSPEERQRANNTGWYSDFKTRIQTRLDEQKSSATSANSENVDLVTSLLATVDPGYFLSGGAFFDHDTSRIAEAEPAPARPTVETPTTIESKTLVAETDSKKERKLSKQIPQQTPAVQTGRKAAKTISPKAGDALLGKFERSFENGNLDGLMQLFAPSATTNHHTSAAEISNSYAELFQTTAKRDLKFSDFTWTTSGNTLEGTGKYLAHLNPKGTNIEQIFSADVSVKVDASNQPVLINGLYLSNQQFSTSLAEAVKSAIPEVQKPSTPDKEELRALLQNFVSSYNRGDVESLMALFSQEARTNDRSNINEIRQDYIELFQTTKSREIVLSNVNWKFTANNAVANGLFEAKVQPLNNRQINIYRGKIRIAVTKYDGGILITQLLHNTQ